MLRGRESCGKKTSVGETISPQGKHEDLGNMAGEKD
jgi:hypothetical protein